MSDAAYSQNVNIGFQGDDDLTPVIDKIAAKLGGFQTAIFAANLGVSKLSKSLGQTAATTNKLVGGLALADKALTKITLNLGAAKVFTILGTGIKDARDALTGFNQGLEAMAANGFSPQIISNFKQVKDAIFANQAAVKSFSLDALTYYNQFKKVETEVATLFPKGDKFVQNLGKNIRNLVNTDLQNAVSSVQALGAAYEAASAGFTEASDNTDVMVAGLKLAKSGGAETATVMRTLASTIRAYNLQASDASKVAAILNQTTLLGITTIPELANGFAQTAVTAKEAGIKLEELGAAVAALTLKGAGTPDALTGIEALSRNIINKTPEAAAALKELRTEAGKPIKFDIAEIKAKGLAKALDDLNKAAKGNAQVLADIIPESTAYSTALSLMAEGTSKLTENTKKMVEVSETGTKARKALDEIFGIKIANQAEQFEGIVNRITEQFIEFGEQLAPVFDVGVKAVENFTKWLAAIPPDIKKLAAQWLIFQLTLQKGFDFFGVIVGTITKAALAFVGWRLSVQLFTGQLPKTIATINGLIKTQAGLIPVIKQIIGLDQSRLLIDTSINTATATKTDLLKKLWKGEGDRLETAKQLLGLDKEYILSVEKANQDLATRSKIIENQINQDSKVKQALSELNKLQKERGVIEAEGLALFNKKNAADDKLLDNLYAIEQAQKELNEALANKDGDTALRARQELNKLNQEQLLIVQEQLDLEKQLGETQSKYDEASKPILEQEAKVTEARTAAKKRLGEQTRNNLKVQKLEAEAAALSTQADEYAARAERLRLAAKSNSAKAGELLAKAELAEAKAKAFSTKATETQTAAQQLNTAIRRQALLAAREQAVAEGTLIKIQSTLGTAYVANIPVLGSFIKLLYTQIPVATSLTGVMAGLNAAFATFKTSLTSTSGDPFPTFAKIAQLLKTGWLTSIGAISKGMSFIVAQASTLIVTMAPFLPLLVAAGVAAAVIYDQTAGTSGQIRELTNNLEKNNDEYDKAIDKLKREYAIKVNLNRLSFDQTITDAKRTKALEQQRQLLEDIKNESSNYKTTWQETGESIGGAYNKLQDFENRFNLVRIAGNAVVDVFKQLAGFIRLEQTEASLNRVNNSIQDNIDIRNKLIKQNKEFKQGLTGDAGADGLIKQGKKIDLETQERLKINFEFQKKTLEAKVNSNDKTLEELQKQIEKTNAALLSDPNAKPRNSREEALLGRFKALEATNEGLKKELEKTKDIQGALQKALAQRNLLIKQMDVNNLVVGEGGTKLVDVGSNAIETSLKKALRTSEEDLQDYQKKVIAYVDGTNKYVEEEVIDEKTGLTKKIVKSLDIAELGDDWLNKLAEKIQTVATGIDNLYKDGFITAADAAQKTLKLIQDTESKKLNIRNPQQYRALLAQVIEYYSQAEKDANDKLEQQAAVYKQLQTNKFITAKEAAQKINAIEQQQLQNQIDFTKKILAQQEKTGSKEAVAKTKRELEILLAQQKNLVLSQNIETFERVERETIAKLDNQLGIYKQLQQAKFLSAKEANEKISKLELDRINKEIETAKKTLAEQKKRGVSQEGLDITLRNITALETQKRVLLLSQAQETIAANYDLELKGYNKLLALNKFYVAALVKDKEFAFNSEITSQQNLNTKRQKILQEQIAASKKAGAETIELEIELINLKTEYYELDTQRYEQQLQRRLAQAKIASDKEELYYKAAINNLDKTRASLDQQQKLLESRNNLQLAGFDIEQRKLEQSLRVTGDIVKRTQLEEQIVVSKTKQQEAQLKVEQQTFEIQQKLVAIGFQRQEIELKIRAIQLQSNALELQASLEKAQRNKALKEEIDAILLRLDANKQEQSLLQTQQGLLKEAVANNKEIAANSRKQLADKQAIARQGGLLDLEISKQNTVIAGYEKQAKQAQVSAQYAEIEGQKRLKNIEFVEQATQKQTEFLQAQQQILETQGAAFSKQLSVLASLTTNERQRQKIQEDLAKAELISLKEKQKLETKLLDLQLQGNRNALERQQIEQQTAVLRLQAELKIQAAETKKVLASKTASQEEKDAATAQLDAKQFALSAQQYQGLLLNDRQKQLAQEEALQRYSLAAKQQSETLDAQAGLVGATRSKADDRKLARLLRDKLRDERQGLRNTRNGDLLYLGQDVVAPTIAAPSTTLSFEQFLKQQQQLPATQVAQRYTASSNGAVATTAAPTTTTSKVEAPIALTVNLYGEVNTNEYRDKIIEITYDALRTTIKKTNTELNK